LYGCISANVDGEGQAANMGVLEGVDRKRMLILAGGGLLVIGFIWLIARAFVSTPAEEPANAALAEVAKQEAKKDIEGLKSSIRSKNDAVARRAIISIRTLAPPDQAAAAIQPALTDSRSLVRQVAFTQLGNIGPVARPYMPDMTSAMGKDPAPEVRASAAQALGKVASTEAIDPLFKGFGDPDPAVRRSSMEALESMLHMTLGFNPDAEPPARAKELARIGPMVPKFKSAYAQYLVYMKQKRHEEARTP